MSCMKISSSQVSDNKSMDETVIRYGDKSISKLCIKEANDQLHEMHSCLIKTENRLQAKEIEIKNNRVEYESILREKSIEFENLRKQKLAQDEKVSRLEKEILNLINKIEKFKECVLKECNNLAV